MAKFELEKVENQQNPAIPAEAKKVVGVSGDIYVWAGSDGIWFYACGLDFVNLQESVFGFGETTGDAINDLSDRKQDEDLSGRPELTEDGPDWAKKSAESIDKGLIQNAAGGSTEPMR